MIKNEKIKDIALNYAKEGYEKYSLFLIARDVILLDGKLGNNFVFAIDVREKDYPDAIPVIGLPQLVLVDEVTLEAKDSILTPEVQSQLQKSISN